MKIRQRLINWISNIFVSFCIVIVFVSGWLQSSNLLLYVIWGITTPGRSDSNRLWLQFNFVLLDQCVSHYKFLLNLMLLITLLTSIIIMFFSVCSSESGLWFFYAVFKSFVGYINMVSSCLASDSSSISHASCTQLKISIPFKGCRSKFSGKLSTIITFDRSLPRMERSFAHTQL